MLCWIAVNQGCDHLCAAFFDRLTKVPVGMSAPLNECCTTFPLTQPICRSKLFSVLSYQAQPNLLCPVVLEPSAPRTTEPSKKSPMPVGIATPGSEPGRYCFGIFCSSTMATQIR